MCLWSRFVFLGKGQETHEKVEQAMEEEKDARVRWKQSSQRGSEEQQRWENQKLAHPQRVKLEDVSCTGNEREGRKCD